jgi:hypothetical protein
VLGVEPLERNTAGKLGIVVAPDAVAIEDFDARPRVAKWQSVAADDDGSRDSGKSSSESDGPASHRHDPMVFR